MNQPAAIGIDIGGTKIACALVREDGEVLDLFKIPFEKQRAPREVIAEVTVRAWNMAVGSGLSPAGIGIGCPGQVDVQSGLVKNAVNLGWPEINLIHETKKSLPQDMPVFIRKDADANLLAEFFYGAARDFTDVVYLCIGSGLGCSIVSGGRLVEGASGTAGGFGHIRLEGNEIICPCGLRGCAETIISGPGLVRQFQEAPHSFRNGAADPPTSPEGILALARSGDTAAVHALKILAQALGYIFSVCISIINPRAILIGGGLGMAAFDAIVPTAAALMRKHSLPHTYRDLKILPASPQSSAVGAACLVWNSNKTDYQRR